MNGNTGVVEKNSLGVLKHWDSNTTLEKILLAIKDEMKKHRNLHQPAEGTNF